MCANCHIVQTQCQVRCPQLLQFAAVRMGLENPVKQTWQVYKATKFGWGIKLKNWLFPVVFDTEKGEMYYDNFEDNWGNIKQLHKLLQAYQLETTLQTAQNQGLDCEIIGFEDRLEVHVNVGE